MKKTYLHGMILSVVFAIITACGDDNSSSANDFVINNETISGVSQKGPFINGSSVTVQELDGKTLAQTGKSFKGKITSDKGEFNVSSVSLASQYVLLEANGFYKNEVTGEKSNASIILNALTDLSDRKNVNINLLTHLEYERALYLVKEGMNVSDAKKQAKTEILKAFGISGDFNNSEDLTLFEEGDGNAALLAISVLMQGDLSEADFSERLANFATDIKEDGKWDDEITIAQIADFASRVELMVIRKNIEKWNLGVVPDFEKYVNGFWYKEFGLGNCNNKTKGKVVVATNVRSKKNDAQTRYICKEKWVVATDIEKDTFEWAAGVDGEIRIGDVTSRIYKYDEMKNTWLYANKNDTFLGINACTKKQEGKSSIVKDSIYYCYANNWENVTVWNWNRPKEFWQSKSITYDTIIDSRDKKIYKIVKIGNQTWMAENLNYSDSVTTKSLEKNSWCHYDVAAYCDIAGRLYT